MSNNFWSRTCGCSDKHSTVLYSSISLVCITFVALID